jgi:YVTN family beta-propeller protein
MILARTPRLSVLALAASSICLAILPRIPISSADVRVKNEPASEGRPITPAGELVLDLTTRLPAVGSLPVDLVRSPDREGWDGRGRYLVAVNSGYGLQFSSATNKAQQSLAVIDLKARPAPAVIQNIYFPTPQSVNVGLVFAPRADADGAFRMYVSGGFENKVWVFKFTSGAREPVAPNTPGQGNREAPSIDLSALAAARPTPRENDNHANVYPTGLATSDDGDTLYVANNLDDSLGVVTNLRGAAPAVARVELRGEGHTSALYPYGVASLQRARQSNALTKIYVSCWNDSSLAVVNGQTLRVARRIAVSSHPTALIFNDARTRLYVVNSNADSVSVIDTEADAEIERINVRLSEDARLGHSPESLALGAGGATLYVANAHSNALAVVALSPRAQGDGASVVARGASHAREDESAASKDESGRRESVRRGDETERREVDRSRVRGFIPTGQYPSAVAVVAASDGETIFVGNGKGTGFENSSVIVDNSGRVPNAPNDRFPSGSGRGMKAGGEYSPAIVAGNISAIHAPDAARLAAYTRQVMRNDGLLDAPRASLFRGVRSPIKHVVYVIKENRTYDQLFGDIARAGDSSRADGDSALAIFGAGEAARSPQGQTQNVTPNQRALALRFGLLDRFFVNAEASADGHNWSTAAISNDYTDKAFRWNYSSRGRTYDFEGFVRLPNYRVIKDKPPLFPRAVTAEELADFMRRFVPYLNNSESISEPASLYLWDAAARAGLSYRNYGEYLGTISASDIVAVNSNQRRKYPDLSPTVQAFPTKKSLEGHHSTTYRNFDMYTPDAMTNDSYRAAKESNGRIDPLISSWNAEARFRGTSRTGEWLREFRSYVEDLRAGRGDHLPNLSILRLPNDHTEGSTTGMPTPQFYVAENDYAVGLIVEAVSSSPYWRDTAIFVVEDDAQDGPDHVDAHRSPALVISAYNRAGALMHTFHTTVSLIRTIELLLAVAPMNQLDATAAPINIFQPTADLRPFKAILPNVAFDNLLISQPTDAEARYWAERTAEQNLEQADQADARVLNAAIWFAVRGTACPLPQTARLPVIDSMLVPSFADEKNAGKTQVAVGR